MINMNRPSNHPDFENANGSDNAPAPNVAEHKLNTEPRTEPSRNHLLNASLGSAALAIFHKGVPGDHKGEAKPGFKLVGKEDSGSLSVEECVFLR